MDIIIILYVGVKCLFSPLLQVRSSCRGCQRCPSQCEACSEMDCSISSIAKLCLQAPPESIAQGFSTASQIEILPPGNEASSIECWLRENLTRRDIENGLFHSLVPVLRAVHDIICTIPPGSTNTEQINCNVDDSF